MNTQNTIIAIEALFDTLDENTSESTKLKAINLCMCLEDETGDVMNELLDHIYGPVFLKALLLEASEEGAEYECTDAQVDAFISNRMDNEDFEAFNNIDDVRVTDASTDDWIAEFKEWLQD